ncbi:MAG: HlyD family efflux transporter periplasmic adaptor subunit [Candidatus Parcubacteria bacterium]|nr:HlyD family efflux transporter periplasmic adaptor subunit [Candidatus Parcubacteria bacterium]
MKWILNKLKNLAKKKSFWFLLIVVVGVVALIFYFTRPKAPVYVTEKVQKGNLVQTVSETGMIESASAIDLNFKGTGILAQVNVKEGESVKAGDVLASLDAGSLAIAARQAQANLDMSQANLNKLLAGASAEDLKVTEETVNNAKIAADNAQLKFDDTQNQSTKSISDVRQNLINEIDKQIAISRTAMDAIKIIFDDVFLTYQFSVRNTQYGINAHNYYDESKVRILAAETSITTLKASDAEVNLADAVAKLNDVQSWIKNALDNTYLGLINTLVGNQYSEAQFLTDKTNINNQQNILNAGISTLDSANQNYSNAKLNLGSNYIQAKANLDSAIGAYNLAKAQYDFKKAPPRRVDIASYQAQVDQAQAAYALALNNLDDYTIYAPTAGVITFVNYKIGEQVSSVASKPVIAMMGQSDFQIKVDVPESDIVKIKVGDLAKITLDAYGSDQIFNGKVVLIDVAETIIQDVVYYKITIQLDPTDKEIKSGMTANVDLITATLENVLYVSNRVIKQDPNGQKYVEVLGFGNIIKKVNIEAGLRADIGTEIKSGLSEGQEIIVSKK